MYEDRLTWLFIIDFKYVFNISLISDILKTYLKSIIKSHVSLSSYMALEKLNYLILCLF